MTTKHITVFYAGKPKKVTPDRLATAASVVEKALDARYQQLDKDRCRIFFNTDTRPKAWDEGIPDECEMITILRVFSLTVVYDDVPQNPLNVLEGSLLANDLETRYLHINPTLHIVSINSISLGEQYWTKTITGDTEVRIETKYIPEFPISE